MTLLFAGVEVFSGGGSVISSECDRWEPTSSSSTSISSSWTLGGGLAGDFLVESGAVDGCFLNSLLQLVQMNSKACFILGFISPNTLAISVKHGWWQPWEQIRQLKRGSSVRVLLKYWLQIPHMSFSNASKRLMM